MSTNIIHAELAQLSDVACLFDDYRRFYGQPSDAEGARAFIAARLENGDSTIFVVYRRSTAVGFTQLYPSFSSVTMRRIWILNDLFVAESARRTGVACLLLEQAKQFVRNANGIRLVLSTARDNRAAQSLYEATGWQKETDFIQYKHPL